VHGLATLLLDGPLASLADGDRARAISRLSDFALDGLTGTARSGPLKRSRCG